MNDTIKARRYYIRPQIGVFMLTVIITLNDGTQNVKDCWAVSDLCLDGVLEIRVIRDEKAA